MIGKEAVCGLVEKIKPAVEKIKKIPKLGPLSFFEVYTALAFLYFKQKKVDIAVVETGLGGRLDATNVVNPLACAVTPISLEHTNRLGYTLREIAQEKAGIIKRGVEVVSAPQKKEALKVLQDTCKRKKARLSFAGNTSLRVKRGHAPFYPPLLGAHQKVNASAAVSLAGVLNKKGFRISDAAIRRGLKNTRWPGRLEVINKRPLVVLDGAQNAESAAALASSVKKLFSYERLILVLAVCLEKDVRGIWAELLPFADHVILTESKNPRAMPAREMLKGLLQNWDHPRHGKSRRGELSPFCIDIIRSSGDALKRALAVCGRNDLVLIAGSFYLIGEIKSACKKLIP